MDNFSMKLDLSNFFKDERRQSLIFIDANWVNIKNAQDHIQNLFKLMDINLLTADGCFLPPRESIQVLKGAKGLKAFRFQDPEQNGFSIPASVGTKKQSSKKRKYTAAEEEVELPCSTPSRPSKRSKKKSSVVPELQAETSPELSIAPFEFPLRSSQNSTKYDQSNEEPSASSLSGRSSRTLQREASVTVTAEDQDIAEEVAAPLNEVPAPLPIAFRCPLMELDSNTGRTFEFPTKKNNIVIIQNIEIMPAGAANGIHREPVAVNTTEEASAESSVAEKAEESQLLNSTADLKADTIRQEDEKPEETVTEAETSQTEEKVEACLLPTIAPMATLSPVRICAESLSSDTDDDDVMVLDDTNVDDSDSDVQAVAPTEEPKAERDSDIIRDMMQSSMPLNTLPSRGDSILFKLLKVKGDPSSGSTDFIAGTCTYINRRSKVITVELISCPSEFKRILRQYNSSLDETGDEVRCLNVCAKDMTESKIIVNTID